MAGGGGDLAPRVSKALRSLLGEMFRVPADRIYPADSFEKLFDQLRSRDWDVVEFLFAVEDEFDMAIECDEDLGYECNEKLDGLTDLRTITVGDWVCCMTKLLQERLGHGVD